MYRGSILAYALLCSTLVATGLCLDPLFASNAFSSSRPDKKLVYAHWMVGTTAFYEVSDFENDINAARKYGVDAFALNIGIDPYTEKVLDNAYAAAAKYSDFKMFISFDFNWWPLNQESTVKSVAYYLDKYCQLPAQQIVNGRCFSGSFAGDGFDYNSVRHISQYAPGHYFCPNWHDGSISPGISSGAIDCVHNWMGWASQNNRAVNYSLTPEADLKHISSVGSDAGYMAGISPWFFTHFGPFVSFEKNWVFKSEEVFLSRWQQILNLERSPDFIELETWNDFGESHYLGPLNTRHSDDGSEGWTKNFPHDAFLVLAQPYITAFKHGEKQPRITRDLLVTWFRPTPKNTNSSGIMPEYQGKAMYPSTPPEGWELLEDVIFVATFMTQPGKLLASSGCNSVEIDLPAGVSFNKINMGVGKQSFQVMREDKIILNGVAPMEITEALEIFNFNVYSCWIDSDGIHEYNEFNFDTTANNIIAIQGTAGPAPQSFNGVTRTVADFETLHFVANTFTGNLPSCTASSTLKLPSAPVFTPFFTDALGNFIKPTWSGYLQAEFTPPSLLEDILRDVEDVVPNAGAQPTPTPTAGQASNVALPSLISKVRRCKPKKNSFKKSVTKLILRKR